MTPTFDCYVITFTTFASYQCVTNIAVTTSVVTKTLIICLFSGFVLIW